MNSHLTVDNRKRWNARWIWTGVGIVAASLIIAVAVGQAKNEDIVKSPAVLTLEETGRAFADVTQKAAPAVVFISVQKNYAATISDPLEGLRGHPQEEMLKRFFGGQLRHFESPQPRRSTGQGSGFIISQDGFILTNAHVVKDASKLKVTLSDGREFSAKTVGVDTKTDVAVIKVEAKNLPVLKMGDSENIQVGQWVLAVGSPFGLPGTVTSGIVSAKDRTGMGITEYENFIQTDAAINPGNSGGPLVNLQGEVVGINTAIFSRSGGYMGIGFAIPINMAKDVSDALIKNGHVTRGYLGIMIQELTSALAKSFGFNAKSGVLVGDVMSNSPADKAGIRTGDIVHRFNGEMIKNVDAFRKRIANSKPDQELTLTVWRASKELALKVRIGKMGSVTDSAPKLSENPGEDKLGVTLGSLTDELRKRLGYESKTGVVVLGVKTGSKAAEAGIRKGMIIMEVNRRSVKSVEEFRQRLAESKDMLLLLVSNKGATRFVAVNMG